MTAEKSIFPGHFQKRRCTATFYAAVLCCGASPSRFFRVRKPKHKKTPPKSCRGAAVQRCICFTRNSLSKRQLGPKNNQVRTKLILRGQARPKTNPVRTNLILRATPSVRPLQSVACKVVSPKEVCTKSAMKIHIYLTIFK